MLDFSLKNFRKHYYVFSFFIFVLGAIYSILVYNAGQFESLELGSHYLMGIPNYYFFYMIILPFICAGISYLALHNRNTRLFGALNKSLDDKKKKIVNRYRRILFPVAIVFSLMVVGSDMMEKDNVLPPYTYDLKSEENQHRVAKVYACLKGWQREGCQQQNQTGALTEVYLQQLQHAGFEGGSVTGFDSISQWYVDASFLYKFETFLSFFGAFIVCIAFSQLFLLVVVKDRILESTKDIIIWIAVLLSFWFPTKYWSSYHYSLSKNEVVPSSILTFALALFAIGILIAIFIRVKKIDLKNFSSLIAGIFSFAVSYAAFVQKEAFGKLLNIIQGWSLMYIIIMVFVIFFCLFVVTSYFIERHESEANPQG